MLRKDKFVLMNNTGLSYIDLFAGAGGLSEGFIQSGYQPIAHVEMNEHAAKTTGGSPQTGQ